MPVTVRKQGDVYRVVESSSGRIVRRTKGGKASDGGGHSSRAKATRQANAINRSMRKKNDS